MAGPGKLGRRSKAEGGRNTHKDRLARLDQMAFRAAVQFTQEECDVLNAIAAGKPPRNASAILHAMELKAAYGYSKPKSEVEHTGDMTFVVESGIEAPPGSRAGN